MTDIWYGRGRARPFWLLAGLAFLLAAACQPGENPPAPQARAFQALVREHLGALDQRLAPLAALNDQEGAVRALNDYYQEAQRNGRPLPFAVLALDRTGALLASRAWSQGPPWGPAADAAQYYSNYRVVEEALKEGKTARGVLYLSQGKVFAVCAPLKQGRTRVGAVCLYFPEEALNQGMGVGEEDFKRLDF